MKRREAVRRKTAQYLLKAEALYNTYLVGNESLATSEQVLNDCCHSHFCLPFTCNNFLLPTVSSNYTDLSDYQG